jgi:DHA1 family bicyclomycin/chloramphenicol resistance-like MFS transporter
VLTLIMTAVIVPETRPAGDGRRPLAPRIRAVLVDRRFRSATVVAAMTYAGVYAYVAAAPLLLEQVYGLSPRAFAVVFLINSLGLVLGVQLASVSARKHDARSVLLAAVVVGVLAAAAILPLQWLGTGLVGLLPCLWVFIVGCGACFPCAEAIAFDDQGGQAGTATSLHGFVCFAVAGLVSPLPGLWGIVDPAPVAGILLGTSVISLITVIMIGSVAGAPADREGSAEVAGPSTMNT